MVTIFKNIFSKEPNYITAVSALERIKQGKSKDAISEIRTQISKDRANKLKSNLPSICFSGKFTERFDDKLTAHSGLLVLDFDDVSELREKQTDIISNNFVYACWVSPGGNGLKALVKIADGTNTAAFPLVQGTNQIKMGWADENVRVDKISITSNPYYIL